MITNKEPTTTKTLESFTDENTSPETTSLATTETLITETSSTEELTPVTEELTPVTEEVTPVTEEVAPVTEEVTPVTEALPTTTTLSAIETTQTATLLAGTQPITAETILATTVVTTNATIIGGAEAFHTEVSSLMNHSDIQSILKAQASVFQKFTESKQTLASFNEFSASMYAALAPEYDKHTKMLKEMKKDLDSVFKRIRNLEVMLRQKFPDAFEKR